MLCHECFSGIPRTLQLRLPDPPHRIPLALSGIPFHPPTPALPSTPALFSLSQKRNIKRNIKRKSCRGLRDGKMTRSVQQDVPRGWTRKAPRRSDIHRILLVLPKVIDIYSFFFCRYRPYRGALSRRSGKTRARFLQRLSSSRLTAGEGGGGTNPPPPPPPPPRRRLPSVVEAGVAASQSRVSFLAKSRAPLPPPPPSWLQLKKRSSSREAESAELGGRGRGRSSEGGGGWGTHRVRLRFFPRDTSPLIIIVAQSTSAPHYHHRSNVG